MANPNTLVPVSGSEPTSINHDKPIGPASPDELLLVTVKVRAKGDTIAADDHPLQAHAISAVSRHDFAAKHGADPAVLAKVEAYAKSQGLNVVESSATKRRVMLAGPLSTFEKAFGVTLQEFTHDGGTYRAHAGQVHIPADLEPEIEAVLGLTNRPVAKPHFQYKAKTAGAAAPHAAGSPVPLSPLDVARLYDFPTGLDGSGQCIGILELGGGYRPADITAYFQGLGLPVPSVSSVSVLGGANSPGQDADGEVMLDIEVAGAVAPKAKIVVYFSPNTFQGFVQAITDAAHDTVNKPSVLSISWGSSESNWTKSARTALSNALKDAATVGMTVTVASGDNGSSDGVAGTKPHVDFPSSSPYALACGGTRLIGNGSTISSETVWNDGPDSATGGGVSDAFPIPAYQSGANVPKSKSKPGYAGRGVPDVSGDADPNSGYKVRVNGQNEVVGGTSAVAPLWAGLIALMNQKLGKAVGFLNPLLYTTVKTAGAFHDVTSGNNGAFSAGVGWDACTGLGTPDGAKILAALGGAAPSTPTHAHSAPAAVAVGS